MTPDEQVAIYNKGVQAGKEHSTPSPETVKRLNKLEDATTSISKMLAVFEQKTSDYHDRQDEKQKEQSGKLDVIMTEVRYTNGKVRKITIALVAVAAFSMGLGIVQAQTILSLFL